MNELFAEPAPTVEPGIYPDMTNEAYHQAPGVSNSGLTLVGRSPAHYYGQRLDPNRPPEKDKPGQLEGNLAHCAILEPDAFDQRYVIGPTVNRNTKQWKEFAAAAEAEGKAAIQQDQYDAAWAQHRSVWSIPDLRDALQTPGLAEPSAFWIDEETGELCKVRPDWAASYSAGDLLLDVKTYTSADPGEVSRQIARKKYQQQSGMYPEGWAKATGRSVLGFIFIFIETEYPYVATPVMLDTDSQDQGYRMYRHNLNVYAECRRTDRWPAYTDGVEIVRLPEYTLREA